MTEPENHTIRLLQEMRAEMRQRFNLIDGRFEHVDAKLQKNDSRFDRLEAEIARTQASIDRVQADVSETKSVVREVVVRLTLIEKRLKAVEPA